MTPYKIGQQDEQSKIYWNHWLHIPLGWNPAMSINLLSQRKKTTVLGLKFLNTQKVGLTPIGSRPKNGGTKKSFYKSKNGPSSRTSLKEIPARKRLSVVRTGIHLKTLITVTLCPTLMHMFGNKPSYIHICINLGYRAQDSTISCRSNYMWHMWQRRAKPVSQSVT